MSLKLNSIGGGSVTLQEPNTASNLTLDLPAAAGTVALTSQIPAATSTDYGGIGTYFVGALTNSGTVNTTPNTTVAGSSLLVANLNSNSSIQPSMTLASTVSPGLSGTWRAMGYNGNGVDFGLNSNYRISNIFVRIS
jgi:hypothetical protein